MSAAHILIVEDEQVVAMDLECLLIELGYSVAGLASTGVEAMLVAAEQAPDLVLMDIRLQGDMDGIAVAEQISARHDIPIIYLTAYSDGPTRERATATRPYGYLLKPFDERTLQMTIETCLARHWADREVRRSTRWLTTTLGSIGEAIVTANTMGQITYLNSAAETLLRVDAAQMIGRGLSDVVGMVDTGTGLSLSMPDSCTHDVDSLAYAPREAALTQPGGTQVHVEYQLRSICLDAATPLGWVLVLRDVTLRKQAEVEQLERERQHEQLKHLERLRVLSAGLAHDLNNLLTGVLGYAEMALLDLPHNHEAALAVVQIEALTHQASATIRSLLAYAGRARLTTRPVQLNELVRKSIAALHDTSLCGRTVHTRLDPQLAPALGDELQLQHVVQSLLINAAEALDGLDGEITVTTAVEELPTLAAAETITGVQVEAGSYLSLAVHDSGVGMTEEVRPHIFDPFFSTKVHGRGLGLAAVSGTVREHNGTITTTSAPGEGSTVRVYLPLRAALSADPHPSGAAAARWKGRGAVLVIDDEPVLREVASHYLGRIGFEVVTATNSAGGLAALQSPPPGVPFVAVLLDLTLPGMSGPQIAQAIRAVYPDLPILLMSGYTQEDVQQWLASVHQVAFIAKPFTLAQLQMRFQQLLDVVAPA